MTSLMKALRGSFSAWLAIASISCCFCQANYSPSWASAGSPLSLTLGLEKTCFFLLIFFFKQVNNILALKGPKRWSQQLIQVGDEGVASLPLGIWDALCLGWSIPKLGTTLNGAVR